MSNTMKKHDSDLFDLGSYLEDPAFAAAYEDVAIRTQLRANLVAQRRAMKVTQAQVAERMDTTQSFVSEFENGGTDPHLSTLQRYGRAVCARLSIRVDRVPIGSPSDTVIPVHTTRPTHATRKIAAKKTTAKRVSTTPK